MILCMYTAYAHTVSVCLVFSVVLYSIAIRVPMEEQTAQFINDPTEQMLRYIGNSRGIQGHQNSCYLDSTLFGLFALSDVFDSMFLAPDQSITTDQNRKRVANLLWKGIVNPLRKYPNFIIYLVTNMYLFQEWCGEV